MFLASALSNIRSVRVGVYKKRFVISHLLLPVSMYRLLIDVVLQYMCCTCAGA